MSTVPSIYSNVGLPSHLHRFFPNLLSHSSPPAALPSTRLPYASTPPPRKRKGASATWSTSALKLSRRESTGWRRFAGNPGSFRVFDSMESTTRRFCLFFPRAILVDDKGSEKATMGTRWSTGCGGRQQRPRACNIHCLQGQRS